VRRRRAFGLAVAGILSLVPLASAALRAARASNSEPLLPNLIADPPDNATLVTDSIEGTSQLLLRFNGYVQNAGPGALDFRGARETPTVKGKSAHELKEEIALYKYREESLPQGLEEELAAPAMSVSQRLYTTNEGDPQDSERYLERPHVEEPSPAEMFYSNADGHHHWHLQHVAKYSLWNASRTAEVAPAQKVGFCLDDSQHIEPNVGPSAPVYSNSVPPYLGFCRQFEPNATSVYEGISPGWRDVYNRELAFQWVDASDVLPGEYWLREEVDPTGVIKQTGGGPKVEYATTPTVIPGFDAEAATDSVNEDETKTVNLLTRSYEDEATPVYRIVSKPQHGTLGEVEGGQVTYTPEAGYSGNDSFSFSASDPTSAFPEHPAVATVSISVESAAPSVLISGAQAEMTAGTSVQLSATATHYSGEVEWEASDGTLTPAGLGFGDRERIYTAPLEPPPGATVTVTARLKEDPAVSDQQTIMIQPVPPVEPVPELPPVSSAGTGPPSGFLPSSGSSLTTGSSPSSGSPGSQPGGSKTKSTSSSRASGSHSGRPRHRGLHRGSPLHRGLYRSGVSSPVAPVSISRPRAMIVGRVLVMTATPSAAGRIRLTAYLGEHALGTCVTETPGGRSFTCRIRIGLKVSLRAPVSVRASLRAAGMLVQAVLPAQRIPEMKMRPIGAIAGVASVGGVFWCSPSTLVGVLVGG
jgi:hypothetical protein